MQIKFELKTTEMEKQPQQEKETEREREQRSMKKATVALPEGWRPAEVWLTTAGRQMERGWSLWDRLCAAQPRPTQAQRIWRTTINKADLELPPYLELSFACSLDLWCLLFF